MSVGRVLVVQKLTAPVSVAQLSVAQMLVEHLWEVKTLTVPVSVEQL